MDGNKVNGNKYLLSPLFITVIFYCTGIWLCELVTISHGILHLGAASAFLLCLILKKQIRWIFYTGCLMTGLTAGKSALLNPVEAHLPVFPVTGTMTGVVEKEIRYPRVEGAYESRAFLIRVDSLELDIDEEHDFRHSKATLQLTLSDHHKETDPGPGDTIHAEGVFTIKSKPDSWIPSPDPVVRLYVGRSGAISILNHWRGSSMMEGIRLALQSGLNEAIGRDDRCTRLLVSMGLGVRPESFSQDIDPFRRTGTSHLFAISGFHVGLIALAVFQIIQMMIPERRTVAIISIPVIWLYIVLTGVPPSAARAGTMASIVLLGICLDKPVHWTNSLHLAALTQGILNPLIIMSPGFLLSFGAVFWILLFIPRMQERINTFRLKDPLLPEYLVPRWHRPVERIIRGLLSSFCLSVVCWLGTLPLIMTIFEEASIFGIVMNIVMIPSAGLCLVSLLLGWSTFYFLPWAGDVFFHAAYGWMQFMIKISEGPSSLDWAMFSLPVNHPVYWVFFFVWLVAGGIGMETKSKFKSILWLATGSLLMMVQLFPVNGNGDRSEKIISLTRHGSQLLHIQSPTHPTLLIDCGRSRDTDYFWSILEHEPKPDIMLLRHASSAQMEGNLNWLQKLPETSWYYDKKGDFRSRAWSGFINSPMTTETFHFRDLIDSVPEVNFIFPVEERDRSSNGASDYPLVMIYRSILICPPLSRKAQAEILDLFLPELYEIEGIICTLNSEPVPLEPWFVNAWKPDWVFIGDSRFPAANRFLDRDYAGWKSTLDCPLILRQSSQNGFSNSDSHYGWKWLNNRAELTYSPTKR